MRSPLLFLLCLIISSGAQADIYKCQGSDGKLTFSDRPCPDKAAQQIIEQSAPVMDSAESPAKASANSSRCATAVKNAHDWLESMRDVGQRNVDTGHMEQAEYDRGLGELNKLSGLVSIGDCEMAQGKKQKFYECLTKITNHLSLCMRQHDPF